MLLDDVRVDRLCGLSFLKLWSGFDEMMVGKTAVGLMQSALGLSATSLEPVTWGGGEGAGVYIPLLLVPLVLESELRGS